jgi:hypothetical protein
MQIKPVDNYAISPKSLQSTVSFKSNSDSTNFTKRINDIIYQAYALEKNSGKSSKKFRSELLNKITPDIDKALNLDKHGNTLNDNEQRKFNDTVKIFQIFNLQENGNKEKLHVLDPQNTKDVMEEFIVRCLDTDIEFLTNENSIPRRLIKPKHKFHRKMTYKTYKDKLGNITTEVFMKKNSMDKFLNAFRTSKDLDALSPEYELYRIKNGQVTRLYKTTSEILKNIEEKHPQNSSESSE